VEISVRGAIRPSGRLGPVATPAAESDVPQPIRAVPSPLTRDDLPRHARFPQTWARRPTAGRLRRRRSAVSKKRAYNSIDPMTRVPLIRLDFQIAVGDAADDLCFEGCSRGEFQDQFLVGAIVFGDLEIHVEFAPRGFAGH